MKTEQVGLMLFKNPEINGYGKDRNLKSKKIENKNKSNAN